MEGTIRLLKNICGMWLLERCRLNWGDTSYPELICEADACEPFRSLINPDDDCFANPADMEKAITEYCRARQTEFYTALLQNIKNGDYRMFNGIKWEPDTWPIWDFIDR